MESPVGASRTVPAGSLDGGQLDREAKAGHRAVVFFLVQRTDCDQVGVAADIDPGYATAFQAALDAGVEVLCYGCQISPGGVTLGQRLPFIPD